MNPSTGYNKLKSILKAAGLPDIRFHDLRHTFATHAQTSGVDAKTLAGILGHTNASFTLDTYSHVTDEMQKNAAQRIDQTIGAVTGVRAICEENVAEAENTQIRNNRRNSSRTRASAANRERDAYRRSAKQHGREDIRHG